MVVKDGIGQLELPCIGPNQNQTSTLGLRETLTPK